MPSSSPTPDAVLLASMRRGEPAAMRVFVDRFRPMLEAYARSARIPRWEWSCCVTELLDDEALRFASSIRPPPANVGAYLMRAVANRYRSSRRANSSRDRRHLSAAESCRGETVVLSSCSEFSIRASHGPGAERQGASPALRDLLDAVRAELSPDDDALLCWLGEGVPNRTIAEWLGITHAAAGKRVWRLKRRLQSRIAKYVAASSGSAHDGLERLMQRVAAESSQLTNAKNAPRAGNATCLFHQ